MMRPPGDRKGRNNVRKRAKMSVNGVTSTTQTAATYSYSSKETNKAAEKTENKAAESAASSGVVYEPTKEETVSSAKKTYKPDINLINKLKADADARTEQLRSLVERMMAGQADAYGKANDIWALLREGRVEVDPATRLQAQEDISEDGYWGVKQTSARILDFATALTGGDPSQIEKMREAFKKGYAQAEKTWGGKLPELSQQTYDAVMKGFDDMAAAAKTDAK